MIDFYSHYTYQFFSISYSIVLKLFDKKSLLHISIDDDEDVVVDDDDIPSTFSIETFELK